MSPQLIFLGPPGSGKGTQAMFLVQNLNYKHVSTGDLLRSEIAKDSSLGKRVSDIMTSGKLVDDSTVLELLNANCDLSSGKYIFDGFPRNLDQAQALELEVLKGVSTKAVFFDIDLDKLAERLVNRRTCRGCGEIYNLLFKAPKKEGVCDKCGGTDLNQREDDNESSVKTRLSVFKETIEPVLKYYEDRGDLHRVDASKSSSEISKLLESIVG